MSDNMELAPEILPPAKKGRPRKDAPLMLNNTEVLTSEERAQHYKDLAAMRTSFKKIREAVKDLARVLHSIGLRMEEIQGRYFEKVKVEDYVRLLEITPSECRAAKCVYLTTLEDPHFLESPDVEDFTSIGKVLKYFRKERDKSLPSPVEFPQSTPDWEQVQKLPNKSSARLQRYRIRAEPTDGQFYVYHNDDAPYPVVNMTVEIPRNFQQETAFEKLRDKIQIALEEYYSIIEDTEEDYQ